MSERRDRKRRASRALRFTGALALLMAVGGGCTFATARVLFPHQHVHAALPPMRFTHAPQPDRKTILLIGTDARAGDPNGNSDVLCVASLDDAHHRVELLSIPRDTQVAFPDGRYRKINDALALGGPALTMHVVENLIGLPIDHYALTRFDGLVKMIDRAGGVQINVQKRMYYTTGDAVHGKIDLQPGLQHLSGEQALGFVRYRHDALGDIGRTQRQQQFLVALKEQLLQPQIIPKLPGIVMDAVNSLDTDMTLVELGKLGAQAHKYTQYQTIHETLPGSFHDPTHGSGDLSYWVVNPHQAHYIAKQFFEDGITQSNPIQDPAVTQTWRVPPSVSKPANTTNTST
ncbi:LCP family protein [Alicyclobacillus fastidiosus]|uniref:LCP family protein n=1 Tax=Alicyclobacillus fastidiosus TaxID=392011 RepID=A0ABV5AFL0_9BACL|nr:LCP family protein [Alicyclobacillus fastidiosus]WEH11624.1 LCP family protein [Alicyclobacillus fastidiosus]